MSIYIIFELTIEKQKLIIYQKKEEKRKEIKKEVKNYEYFKLHIKCLYGKVFHLWSITTLKYMEMIYIIKSNMNSLQQKIFIQIYIIIGKELLIYSQINNNRNQYLRDYSFSMLYNKSNNHNSNVSILFMYQII